MREGREGRRSAGASTCKERNKKMPPPDYGLVPETRDVCEFNRALSYGESGSDVGCLQRHLCREGWLDEESLRSASTAYFGDATMRAVTAWQKRAGIVLPRESDYGFFGPSSIGHYEWRVGKRETDPITGSNRTELREKKAMAEREARARQTAELKKAATVKLPLRRLDPLYYADKASQRAPFLATVFAAGFVVGRAFPGDKPKGK